MKRATVSIERTFWGSHPVHGDWEVDAVVICECLPAEPDVGAPAEAQIVEVREVPGGRLRPDLLELAELEIDSLAEAALEALAEREEDAEERRHEERRDAARGL